jgi:hypothetical protein
LAFSSGEIGGFLYFSGMRRGFHPGGAVIIVFISWVESILALICLLVKP